MRTSINLSKSIVIIILLVAPLLLSSLPAAAKSGTHGFKWIYTYTAGTNTGVLEVTIYEEAKATVYTYPSICTQLADHIACHVDIQALINDSLADGGLPEDVPDEATYPEIFAQVTGKISDRGIDATLVSHPSLDFHLATSKSGRKAEFSTDWSGVQGESGAFTYKRNKTYEMTTAFQPSRFDHYINSSVLSIEGASAAELPFQLDGTTFRIYQPSGFKLFQFIVDPGKPGWG